MAASEPAADVSLLKLDTMPKGALVATLGDSHPQRRPHQRPPQARHRRLSPLGELPLLGLRGSLSDLAEMFASPCHGGARLRLNSAAMGGDVDRSR
jgi:hypothetical protein